jgi:putative ABC transport system permease protein
MRFADLLWLSLSALWQQKIRGLLTTLGVVFGAFVLVFSLSVGQGVQSTLERESHRTVFLRRIIVHPGFAGKKHDQAQEEVKVEGDMSEEKRQRLRQALLGRKQLSPSNQQRINLTQERLEALQNLEHVQSLTPLVTQQAWAILDGQTQYVVACSVETDSASHRQRIIAGDFFRESNEDSVVLSELTCYLLGVKDEAAIQRLIGTKLRLEFRHNPQRAGLNFYLSKSDGSSPTSQEDIVLNKVRMQLPDLLERLNLTPAEKDALRPKNQASQTAASVYPHELTVVGVVRLATTEDRDELDGRSRNADVLLPCETAVKMFFSQKEHDGVGVEGATIVVDREENVREVLGQVQAMNLQAYAPIEYIERERFIYLLIFTTMACVAAVALLVAALGIANTMLMSVLERTREIGIFKAVGAGDSTVQLVFLIEGAFIGLMGGLGGLLLGWAASFPADAWVRSMVLRDLKIELKESLFVFPWWLSVCVVLFAIVVTTLAAVFPARRAARVNPVTALRNE